MIKVIVLAGLITLILSGCAGQPPRVITIEKPIPVPCLDKPVERPEFKPIDPSAPDYELAMALWVDHLDRVAYIARLEAALAGCQ